MRTKISNSLRGERNPMYGKHHSEEAIEKIRKAQIGRKRTEEFKKMISESNRRRTPTNVKGERNPMYGKHHSEEAKRKISEAKKRNHMKIDQSGEKNPLYGKKIINNGKINKSVFKDEIDNYLNDG